MTRRAVLTEEEAEARGSRRAGPLVLAGALLLALLALFCFAGFVWQSRRPVRLGAWLVWGPRCGVVLILDRTAWSPSAGARGVLQMSDLVVVTHDPIRMVGGDYSVPLAAPESWQLGPFRIGRVPMRRTTD